MAPVLDRPAHELVHRPRHRPGQPAALRAPEGEAVALLQAHRRHRVPLRFPGLGVGRARGHRQPHRLRPEDALRALGHRPLLLRPGEQHALDAVRHRARGRADPLAHGLPGRGLQRGRGAQRQGRRRHPHGAQAGQPPGASEGRGPAAVAQRRPLAQGPRPGGHGAPHLERRLRGRRRHRPPVPPAGRDRDAVLHHRRLRHPGRRRGDHPRARHHGAGAGRPGPGRLLPRRQAPRLLTSGPSPRDRCARIVVSEAWDTTIRAQRRRRAVVAPSVREDGHSGPPPTLDVVTTGTLERATALPPLQLGGLTVDPAVVLAPMAGITNPAFRTLCREFGAGLYVCEMITTRALVERNEKTLQMVRATLDEADAFSVQLYGVDPATVGRAVEMLVDEGVAGTRPAHVDLNFGCPVPKVTRKGGGSALPWRRVLFRDIVRAAVRAAGDVPVTVKTRIGIDADHVTYLDAGRIAQDEGAAAITLHGRTADQLYSGTADWAPIARLVEAVDIPVLGNGEVWEADDALRMLAATGAAGVVVGRGCLGRPWLFGDLAAAFSGTPRRALPTLREVAAVMHRHARSEAR